MQPPCGPGGQERDQTSTSPHWYPPLHSHPQGKGLDLGLLLGEGALPARETSAPTWLKAELLCWGAAARQQQAWGRGEHERWPDTAPPPPPWPVGRNTCSKELTRFFWAAAGDAQVHPVQVGVTQKPLQPLG